MNLSIVASVGLSVIKNLMSLNSISAGSGFLAFIFPALLLPMENNFFTHFVHSSFRQSTDDRHYLNSALSLELSVSKKSIYPIRIFRKKFVQFERPME